MIILQGKVKPGSIGIPKKTAPNQLVCLLYHVWVGHLSRLWMPSQPRLYSFSFRGIAVISPLGVAKETKLPFGITISSYMFLIVSLPFSLYQHAIPQKKKKVLPKPT